MVSWIRIVCNSYAASVLVGLACVLDIHARISITRCDENVSCGFLRQSSLPGFPDTACVPTSSVKRQGGVGKSPTRPLLGDHLSTWNSSSRILPGEEVLSHTSGPRRWSQVVKLSASTSERKAVTVYPNL